MSEPIKIDTSFSGYLENPLTKEQIESLRESARASDLRCRKLAPWVWLFTVSSFLVWVSFAMAIILLIVIGFDLEDKTAFFKLYTLAHLPVIFMLLVLDKKVFTYSEEGNDSIMIEGFDYLTGLIFKGDKLEKMKPSYFGENDYNLVEVNGFLSRLKDQGRCPLIFEVEVLHDYIVSTIPKSTPAPLFGAVREK